jgi:hypothetical protein
LPLNGVDYLETDFNKVFEVVGEEDKVVDMLWIKENTLHDVRKSHKYTSGGVEYFGCADRGKFKFGDATRYALYKIISLKNGDKTYRRFTPYKGSTNNFGSGTALSAANTLVVPTHATDYQTMVDLGKIIFDWSGSNSKLFNDLEKIKNMWLKVYDSEGNLIVQDTIIGEKHKTIENLNFGTYKYEIELHSEYNATDSCLTT